MIAVGYNIVAYILWLNDFCGLRQIKSLSFWLQLEYGYTSSDLPL